MSTSWILIGLACLGLFQFIRRLSFRFIGVVACVWLFGQVLFVWQPSDYLHAFTLDFLPDSYQQYITSFLYQWDDLRLKLITLLHTYWSKWLMSLPR